MKRRSFLTALAALGCEPMALGLGQTQASRLAAWAAVWPFLAVSLVDVVHGHVLVPNVAPAVNAAGIRGNPTLHFTGAEHLDCDALTSLWGDPTKSSTVLAYFRSLGHGNGYQTICAAGYDFGSAEVAYQWQNKFPCLATQNGLGVNFDRTDTEEVGFNAFTVSWCYDASRGLTEIRVDSELRSIINGTVPLPAAGLDNFSVGCWLGGGNPTNPFIGELAALAVAAAYLPAAANELSEQWISAAYTLPYDSPDSIRVLPLGDSITRGDSGVDAGWRTAQELEFIVPERLSVTCLGPFSSGSIPNNLHCGQPSATIQVIRDNGLTAIAAHEGFDLIEVMAGTNDAPGNVAAALASYSDMLTQIYAANVAWKPLGKIQVTTLLPIKTGTAGWDHIDPINAGLVVIWDAFEALHPGVLIRSDAFAAVGGVWGAPNFDDTSDGAVHPNPTGYANIWAQALGPAVMPYLSSISPT